jgi:hypothetical protein
MKLFKWLVGLSSGDTKFIQEELGVELKIRA